MAQLQIRTLSSNMFSVNRARKELVSELSMVRDLVPLYDDAADVGITIRSEKTGKVTAWFLSEEHYFHDELTSLELLPTSETLLKNPQLEDWKVILFND